MNVMCMHIMSNSIRGYKIGYTYMQTDYMYMYMYHCIRVHVARPMLTE